MTDTHPTLHLRAHQVAQSLREQHERLLRGLAGLDWESAAAAHFRAAAEAQLRAMVAGAGAADEAADALARHERRVADERHRLDLAARALLACLQ